MRLFRRWKHGADRLAGWGMACLFMLGAAQILASDTNTTAGYLEQNFQQAGMRFKAETNAVEAAWQFGRACFDMADMQSDPAIEARYAEQGIQACRAALALKPNSLEAHYYLGMNLGDLASAKKGLSALRMVREVEREFLAARALDPNFDHAGPDRNLGMLYRDTPSFASIGSRSKARQCLEKAVDLAPDYPENQLTLIESYLKWDYRNEALRQFGQLEKIWPAAKKKYTGVAWQASWADWNRRYNSIRRKLEGNSRVIESPHSQ